MNPIGLIHSPLTDKDDVSHHSPTNYVSTIRLIINQNVLLETFDGITKDFYYWIIYLYQNNQLLDDIIHKRGVYATRDLSRINSIGLVLAKMIGKEGRTILFEQVDIPDQSVVLDIKPFDARYDIPKYSSIPGNTTGHDITIDIKLSERLTVPFDLDQLNQLIGVIQSHSHYRQVTEVDNRNRSGCFTFVWNNFYVETYYDFIRRTVLIENILHINHWELRQLKAEQVEFLKTHPTNEGTTSENLPKNRYSIAVPYNYNRVRLGLEQRYINASHIKIDNFKCIAAQAPLLNTVNDFWEMIHQERLNCVLMLTPLVEKEGVKSIDYFSIEPGQTVDFGQVKVTRVIMPSNFEIDSNDRPYRISKFTVENEGKLHMLSHIYYHGWPDKQPFPHGYQEIDYLCQLYDQHTNGGYSLVHCSAGVARTGTFLAYYLTWLIKQKRLSYRTNRDIVSLLRQQRTGLVQNDPQYDSTVAYRNYLGVDNCQL